MHKTDVEMPGAQQRAQFSEANYDGCTCKRSGITQRNGHLTHRFISSVTEHYHKGMENQAIT